MHIPLMRVRHLKVTTNHSVLLYNRNLYFGPGEILTKEQCRFFELAKKKNYCPLKTVMKSYYIGSGPEIFLPRFSCQQAFQGSPVREHIIHLYYREEMSFFLSHRLKRSGKSHYPSLGAFLLHRYISKHYLKTSLFSTCVIFQSNIFLSRVTYYLVSFVLDILLSSS